MSGNINNDAIDKFCSLTNASFEEAQSFLTATDDNIELAVLLYFGDDIQAPPQSSRQTFPPENNNVTIREETTTTPQITTNATTNATTNGTTITTIDVDDENDENDENDEDNTTTRTANTTAATSSSEHIVLDDDDGMDLDNEDDEEITKISQIDADEELAKLLHQQEEKAAAVRAPIPPRSDILFGNVNGGGSYSIQNPRRSREQLHRTFAGDIRPHHDMFANKPDRLVKMFSPPFDIMSTENFEMTRNRAKSSGKWIMINIQSIGEFSSQVLNRDLWSNDTVKDIIRAHFCFLQYNSDSTDGSKYINFYPVYKYPHVAVIDPRTGERLKVWDSQLEPTEFIINVTDFLDRYSLNEEPNHSESSTAKKTSDGTSEMSVDDQSKAEPQISNDTGGDDQNTFLKKEKEVPKVHPVFEEIPYKSIFDSIKPIERPDQTGPKSTSIKFRLEGRHVIKKFNKKDPVRYMFEYLKASVPELDDKFFELNYLRNNLIEKIDETIEEAGLINAAINVVLG